MSFVGCCFVATFLNPLTPLSVSQATQPISGLHACETCRIQMNTKVDIYNINDHICSMKLHTYFPYEAIISQSNLPKAFRISRAGRCKLAHLALRLFLQPNWFEIGLTGPTTWPTIMSAFVHPLFGWSKQSLLQTYSTIIIFLLASATQYI